MLYKCPWGGGHSCIGTNGYAFSAFYEQEGCTKKWEPLNRRGPKNDDQMNQGGAESEALITRDIEQEGVNNVIYIVPRCEREGYIFHEIMNEGGVGSPTVQPHIPVLFRT